MLCTSPFVLILTNHTEPRIKTHVFKVYILLSITLFKSKITLRGEGREGKRGGEGRIIFLQQNVFVLCRNCLTHFVICAIVSSEEGKVHIDVKVRTLIAYHVMCIPMSTTAGNGRCVCVCCTTH